MTRDEEVWVKDCRDRCRRIKHVGEDLEWVEKPNHSSWMVANASLQDESRISIPKLYFKAEYMPGSKGDRITYALMYMNGTMRCRVFMLEVYPEHIASHRENGRIIFGPHIHLGHPGLGQITRQVISNIEGTLSHKWIEKFRRHARIYDAASHKLCGPFTDDLFGES